MRIVFVSDHADVALKGVLVEHVQSEGHDVIELGTDGAAPVYYPDYGRTLGGAIVDRRTQSEGGSHPARVAKLSMPSQFRGNPA